MGLFNQQQSDTSNNEDYGRYRVVSVLTLPKLMAEVNRMIDMGYVPVGGVFYAGGHLTQAVFLPDGAAKDA